MSIVSSISNAALGRLNNIGASRSSGSRGTTAVTINDIFIPWQKIKESRNLVKSEVNEDLAILLTQLFIEILRLDAVVVPALQKRRGNVIMEAAFLPPKNWRDTPSIMLPIPSYMQTLGIKRFSTDNAGVEQLVSRYVHDFIAFMSPPELVHFIVVAAHEYGHLLSFRQGNHTPDLARGIMYLQQGYANSEIIDRFTWLVFKEEYQAWYYGERLLKRLHFEYWQHFKQVKDNSLATYIKELHLEKARLKTLYRLSFFGDDFVKNSPGEFFKSQRSARS